MTGAQQGAAQVLEEAARRICGRAERDGWRGPDIYDALWTPWPRPLTAGRRRRQAIIQLHARSPLDLRRVYRRRHPLLAKALAVFALADLKLAEGPAGTERLAAARDALETLDGDQAAGEAAWGYPFDMQTRWSWYGRDTPNVVVTSFAVRALAAGDEALGEPRWADRARRGAGWIQDRLFDEELGVYAYHPDSRAVIHNANLLGASSVWRLLPGDEAARDAVARAVDRTLAAQAPDGSFPYGEGPSLGFIDSFHTGYVLSCLCDVEAVDARIAEALERGAAYYGERFFDERGRSLLWPGRPYPEDAHSAGTGLSVLSRLARRGLADVDLVERVGRRAASAMTRDSAAVHRRNRWGATRVRYLRWADSHLALGLATAAGQLGADRSS